MSDGFGPGAHVLYQDFVATPGSQTLSFDLFVGNRADRFATPASLDFALTNPNGALTLNQQVRVDLLRAGADPFSVAAADILLSLYASQVGDPLVSGYRTFATDIGALLAAHSGETASPSLRRNRQPGADAARRRQRRHRRRQRHSRAGVDRAARGRPGGTARAAIARRAERSPA